MLDLTTYTHNIIKQYNTCKTSNTYSERKTMNVEIQSNINFVDEICRTELLDGKNAKFKTTTLKLLNSCFTVILISHREKLKERT